jgi:lipopolysaccharide biosynthesis glycosyltransferase
MNILCSCNDKYAQHCGVMLCSLFENTPEKNIKINLIDGGLNKKNKEKLKFLIESYDSTIVFIKFPKIDLSKIKIGVHGPSSLIRIFVFPKIKEKRILYLDSDMVVKGDVSKIFYEDLKDKILGAVLDGYFQKERYDYLKIPLKKDYFNAGVMLVDLIKWEKKGVDKKIKKEISSEKAYKYSDQDILNCVLYNDWEKINPSWNVVSNAYEGIMMRKSWNLSRKNFKNLLKNPKIIHFTGPIKPWHCLSVHPLRKEYWNYLKKTPWRNFKHEKLDSNLRLKKIIRYCYIKIRKLIPLRFRKRTL